VTSREKSVVKADIDRFNPALCEYGRLTQVSSFAFIVIVAFSSLDTGQPALALFAISSNFA
jgi:hypothetical protein